MSALLPAESMTLTVARAQVERGDASNIQAVLVMTVERLAAVVEGIREAADGFVPIRTGDGQVDQILRLQALKDADTIRRVLDADA